MRLATRATYKRICDEEAACAIREYGRRAKKTADSTGVCTREILTLNSQPHSPSQRCRAAVAAVGPRGVACDSHDRAVGQESAHDVVARISYQQAACTVCEHTQRGAESREGRRATVSRETRGRRARRRRDDAGCKVEQANDVAAGESP